MARLYVLSNHALMLLYIHAQMNIEGKSFVETGDSPFCEWPAKPPIGHLSIETVLKEASANALYGLLARRFGFTEETLLRKPLVKGKLRPFSLTEVQALQLALLCLEGHQRNKALTDLSLSIEEVGGFPFLHMSLVSAVSQCFSKNARTTIKANKEIRKRNEIYYPSSSPSFANSKTERELQSLEKTFGISRREIFKFPTQKRNAGYLTRSSKGIFNLHTAIHAIHLRFVDGSSYDAIEEILGIPNRHVRSMFALSLSETARDILKVSGKMKNQRNAKKK